MPIKAQSRVRKSQGRQGRKAVSPIIATVLLIAIVIVSAGIIVVWSKSFIKEHIEKYGERIDIVCDRIKYDASLSETPQGAYEIAISNQGNDNIHQMNVKVINKGNSAVKSFTPDKNMVAKKTTGKITFTLADFPNFDKFEKIELTPVILGFGANSKSPKLMACSGQTKILSPPK